MSEPTADNSDEEHNVAAWLVWIRRELDSDRESSAIKREMIEQGCYAAQAEELVDCAVREKLADQDIAETARDQWLRLRRKSLRMMLLGILLLAGGVFVTIQTYGAARGGGMYLIWWGAIVVGAVRFVTGLMTYLRPMPTRLDGRRVPGRVLGRYTPGARY